MLEHSICVCSVDSAATLNESLSARVNKANTIVKGLVGETSNATSSVNLSQGNSYHYDDWARRLQEKCNRQGFSNQVVDGIFGENTKWPISLYQENNVLIKDGIVGKGTWSKLDVGNYKQK